MPVYIFQDNYSVVNNDADCKHKAEECQCVDGEIEKFKPCECTYYGDRNCKTWDECRSPVLQEEEDNKEDQKHSFKKRLYDFFDGDTDKCGCVVWYVVCHAIRECVAGFFKLSSYFVAYLNSVGAGGESYAYRYSGVCALVSHKAVALCSKLYPCHISQVYITAVRIGFDDDFFKFFRSGKASFCGHDISFFKIRLGREVTETAERVLAVLIFYRRYNVRRSQVQFSQLVGLQPYTHCVILGSINCCFAYARDSFKVINYIKQGVVAHVCRVITFIRCQKCCYEKQIR